tara:strand:- start:68 stop:565 length:498 start_codon:yes stop_codon:yes gene_type:complete
MSFTRFHDDPCRVEKNLQESTGAGRYMLNVPGNGSKPCFMEDPYIRLQQWGANLMTNPVDLDSKLRGLTTNLNRDCITDNDNVTNLSQSQTVNYPVCNPTTEQPRATHPAWTARDLEQVNWYTLPQDPQKNVLIPFENNVDTRMMERDNFVVTTSCPTQVIDLTK